MPWNWELPNWPQFNYSTPLLSQREREFLLGSGGALAFLKSVDKKERDQFIVEILSTEGLESSKIEGEFLERESLQSSIRQHFGMKSSVKKRGQKETGMAALLCDVYETFDQPLTHEMLWRWHSQLFEENFDLEAVGAYRTHEEPMQIVSRRLDRRHVFFEAPPSNRIPREMDRFIAWFNDANAQESALARAAIAHVYFESIHPFEDGNGRIGRILVEKILSQSVKQPTLIAVSKHLEKNKKEYYLELGNCNKTLNASAWVEFFSGIILQAQEDSMQFLRFLIAKSKLLNTLKGSINARQEKALIKMFEQGPDGFKGGLSAENYIAITKASRATATRDLVDLVEKGALVKTGELRHTRYWLKLLHS